MSDHMLDAAKLTALLEAAVDAIVTINADASIDSLNPAAEKLFGYKASELLGRNVKYLMPEFWAKDHDKYMRRYMETGQRRIIGIGREVRGLKKDGSEFPMHLSVAEYEVDGRRFFTGIIHDLTTRRRAEAALVASQKLEAVGQLTGGIAHDFNNLLTVIVGNLELLELRLEEGGDRELIDEALQAAQLGSDLVKRLLAFAQQTVLEPTQIDPNSAIMDLAILLQRTLGDQITFSTQLADHLWYALVDRSQLESSLLNLVVNAKHAMPHGGQLMIETANVEVSDEFFSTETGLIAGDYVRISVIDSGIGMDEATRLRVFEPFFTTKSAGEGSGLGLSMVSGFAKQSGGRVTVYSEVGVGTTVNLYLPRSTAEIDRAKMAKPSLENAADHAEGRLILVVDDDEKVRRLTLQRLELLGYPTLEAENGQQALSVLEQQADVVLVLTDLVMPGGMTGYELARNIRASKPDLPILLTSGYAEDLLHGDILASQGLQLLRKPYRIADLAKSIASLLPYR